MSGRRGRVRRRPELSQHFIRSPALAASLVAQAPVGPDDLVIEVGPGRGILTAPLADAAREVRGVEVDARLCAHLRRRFEAQPRVSIVLADFLQYRLPRDRPFKVVGNIPFSRTTEIIERLVGADRPPDDVFVVVQREAAERFAGSPFAPESAYSLRLKPWWHVEIGHRLKPSDFEPAPRVDCVVLHLARRLRPLVAERDRESYAGFVHRTFGRTGNTIARCLRAVLSRQQVARLSRDLRFDSSAPPSHLTFDQWLALYRFHRARGTSNSGGSR